MPPLLPISFVLAGVLHGHAAGDRGASVGLEAFAFDAVRGRANITVLGDSITNFTQSDRMFAGFLLEWRPHRWRQIHTSPLSSDQSIAAWVDYAPSAPHQIMHPGQSRSGFEDFAGSCPWSIRAITGEGWSGRALKTGVNHLSFGYETGVLRDADGTGRFLRSGHRERHRTMIVADASPSTRSTWTVRSRNSSAGTGSTTSHADVAFPVGRSIALAWFDDEIDGSTEGLGHATSELRAPPESPLIAGERCGLAGTILTDLELETGLGLAFVGQNSWRAENHRYPAGDPEVPTISTWSPYPGSYSDEALEQHIRAHGSSHFMIWIGTNNGGVDQNAPERTAEDVAEIVDRYRRVHAQASLNSPDLTSPRFLLIAPYDANDTNPYFDGYSAELRRLAISDSDIAFIDLHGLIRQRFGPWSAWESELLDDGTHPNLHGARIFAAMIWRELVAAAGPVADLDRNGIVDGEDLGRLIAAWGCENPGYADLDGDGCVDGSDFGILLGEWSSRG